MTVILERLTGAFALNCELFFLTLLFSLPLGLVVAFGSMSRCAPLRGVVKTFVWVIRGTPLMLQIIVIYLGPGLLGMTNPWPSGSSGRLVAGTGLFILLLGVTLLCASSRPMLVNGEWFESVAWLRVTDMLLYAIYLLLVVAVLCAVLSVTGVFRRIHFKR